MNEAYESIKQGISEAIDMSQINGTREPQTQANNGINQSEMKVGINKKVTPNNWDYQPHTVDNSNINPQVGRIQFSQRDYSDMTKSVDTALKYSDHDEMSMTDCEGKKVSIQYHWDTDIYDTMDVVRRLLIANGFSPETVEHGFEYMWNEFYVDEGDNQ